MVQNIQIYENGNFEKKIKYLLFSYKIYKTDLGQKSMFSGYDAQHFWPQNLEFAFLFLAFFLFEKKRNMLFPIPENKHATNSVF